MYGLRKHLQERAQGTVQGKLSFFLFIFVIFSLAPDSNEAFLSLQTLRPGMRLESLTWDGVWSQVEYPKCGQLSSEQELPEQTPRHASQCAVCTGQGPGVTLHHLLSSEAQSLILHSGTFSTKTVPC